VLGKLPALAEIELSGNQIKSVPGWMKKMKGLQALDISNNAMSAAAITKAREMLEDVELLTD
jgi:Leucine-rich repeat (LRR) protein